MGVLEQINQMRMKGMNDSQIMSYMQDQGVSPMEISRAFNQAQIKSAIEDSSSPENQGYTPSVIERGSQEEYYAPQQEAEYAPSTSYSPQSTEGYSPQGYSQQPQEQGSYSSGTDANTIIEISEQVFEDKSDKIKKQIEELTEFKTLAQIKLDNLSTRLERIETMFDKMQIAILNEIGSYGKKLEKNQKELEMVQDSFSKVVGNVVKKHHKK